MDFDRVKLYTKAGSWANAAFLQLVPRRMIHLWWLRHKQQIANDRSFPATV